MELKEELKHLSEYWAVIADELEGYINKVEKKENDANADRWVNDRIVDFEKDLREFRHHLYDVQPKET